MNASENAEVMLEIFRAIEQRDAARVFSLCQPDVEFVWPPSLPYAGTRGTWTETWIPLQPTWAEQRLDPRVVGATEQEVVVLWQQRGISPGGERLETPVLGLYQMRDGKLARAQMFHFDPAAVSDFLAHARTQT